MNPWHPDLFFWRPHFDQHLGLQRRGNIWGHVGGHLHASILGNGMPHVTYSFFFLETSPPHKIDTKLGGGWVYRCPRQFVGEETFPKETMGRIGYVVS